MGAARLNREITKENARVARSLVIVESPAKAKTINKFLGKNYVVKASMGHVRDLPKSKLGVDEEKNFAPQYTLLPTKKKTIDELKKAAEKADEVYLAADPDREGEAICWHLSEVLKGGKRKFHRVLFNEITKKAVTQAFENPGAIDSNKVDAQQARRILDRLVGYKISPLLWDKVRRGLSAGRVQSVALRIIVDRERDIRAFKTEEYWSITALLTPEEPDAAGAASAGARGMGGRDAAKSGSEPAARISFEAKLIGRLNGGGKSSDDTAPRAAKSDIPNEARAREILADLDVDVAAVPDLLADGLAIKSSPSSRIRWRVSSVTAREKRKNPAPPFTTSKLQQDAARRFGFPVAKTMRIAQALYEGKDVGDRGSVGLITYMRTDSTRVSAEALSEVRQHILQTYGEKALPEKPRVYKSAKDVQDAHEAIRPTLLDLPPQAVRDALTAEEWKLYGLIWNRFVASQMEPAVYDTTTVDITASSQAAPERDASGSAGAGRDPGSRGDAAPDRARPGYLFRASGSVMKSAGWLAVYQEPEETESPSKEDEADEAGSAVATLPPLAEGDPLACQRITPLQHFTQPPPRFTEATLVKELEENGIGRPSTYAAILSVIQSRDYVEKEKGKFHPTPLGELVTDLLVEHFSDIVQVQYTARMEEELDEIEEGKLPWVEALQEFNEKFQKDLADAKKHMRDVKREEIPTDLVCEKCGRGMVKKWGRYGQFLACSGYPECKNTKEIAGEPTNGGADAAAGERGEGPVEAVEAPKESCPKCGSDMVLKRGRFGPFLACSAYPACKTTRRITVGAEGKIESKPDVPLAETCPRCGKNLAVKHGRFGEYTACSDYPACKYIKLKETGVMCPEDGGAIVERKSRRGRVFYGCSNYPACSFVLWNKPVPRPCPKCAAPFLLEKTTKRDGTTLLCNNESCDFKEKAAEPALASVAKR